MLSLAGLAELPAPPCKLLDIRKFREERPEQHAAMLTVLNDF
jgi:hypothetical protein